MTGDFTSTRVQDERLYFFEGPNLMDFDKADADKGQRIFKVCKNVFQFLLISQGNSTAAHPWVYEPICSLGFSITDIDPKCDLIVPF